MDSDLLVRGEFFLDSDYMPSIRLVLRSAHAGIWLRDTFISQSDQTGERDLLEQTQIMIHDVASFIISTRATGPEISMHVDSVGDSHALFMTCTKTGWHAVCEILRPLCDEGTAGHVYIDDGPDDNVNFVVSLGEGEWERLASSAFS